MSFPKAPDVVYKPIKKPVRKPWMTDEIWEDSVRCYARLWKQFGGPEATNWSYEDLCRAIKGEEDNNRSA